MIDNKQLLEKKLKAYEIELHDICERMEEAISLIKVGKEILCYNKMLGVKQKLVLLFDDMRKNNERNKNT